MRASLQAREACVYRAAQALGCVVAERSTRKGFDSTVGWFLKWSTKRYSLFRGGSTAARSRSRTSAAGFFRAAAGGFAEHLDEVFFPVVDDRAGVRVDGPV